MLAAVAPCQDYTPIKPDVKGWGKIEWGMTVAEAKAALGDQATDSTQIPGVNFAFIEKLVIKEFLIGDVHCRVSIESKKGSNVIGGVTISTGVSHDISSRENAFDSFRKLLIEKYGQPKNEDRSAEGGSIRTNALWTFPSTSITLRRSESRYSNGYVSIEYRAADKDALKVV